MALPSGVPTASLRKIPPGLEDMLLARGEWSYCAMEHSRIDAVELTEAGSPFHHLALPLERVPLRFTFRMDGRRQHGRSAPDTVAMIEAGSAGVSHWDQPLESACLYFTDDALGNALGLDRTGVPHLVRTRLDHHSPTLARLLHALFTDARAGQPHGMLVGDAIFLALADALVPSHDRRRNALRQNGEPWRVRNALAFIHAHLTSELSIERIAEAAATSPFHLNRAFRLAMGSSIWRYVLRSRAQLAAMLMRDARLSLTEIAYAAGFKTYPSFIAACRSELGGTPRNLRRYSNLTPQ